MAHWMLAPIDHRAEIWRTYPVQRIVVEAPDEAGARRRIAEAAPPSSAAEPWLVSCPDLLRRSRSWRDDERAMISAPERGILRRMNEMAAPAGGGDRGGFWLGLAKVAPAEAGASLEDGKVSGIKTTTRSECFGPLGLAIVDSPLRQPLLTRRAFGVLILRLRRAAVLHRAAWRYLGRRSAGFLLLLP
jgi:hypothetical protein